MVRSDDSGRERRAPPRPAGGSRGEPGGRRRPREPPRRSARDASRAEPTCGRASRAAAGDDRNGRATAIRAAAPEREGRASACAREAGKRGGRARRARFRAAVRKVREAPLHRKSTSVVLPEVCKAPEAALFSRGVRVPVRLIRLLLSHRRYGSAKAGRAHAHVLLHRRPAGADAGSDFNARILRQKLCIEDLALSTSLEAMQIGSTSVRGD